MAVRASFSWMAIGQGTLFILQFISTIIVARLLGPYDMGVYAVALAVVGMIAVVQAVGLNAFLVREPELTSEKISTASTVSGLIAVSMAIAIGGVGLFGGQLFKDPGVQNLLLVLAVVPILGQISFVPNAMLEREGNFRTIAIVRAVMALFTIITTVTLALLGFRYMSLAYSQFATVLLNNLIISYIGRHHLNYRPSLAHWRPMSRFSAQIFAISGLNRVAGRLMELMLGQTLGIAALGLYSRASSNQSMVWDSIHGVVTRVVFADFARAIREGHSLRDRYLKVLEMMTGLLWPVFAGVAVLAGPLIHLIYGRAWTGAAVPLSLLCCSSILLVSTTMTWEVFVVRNETGRQARFEFVRTSLGTTLFIAACFHSLAAAAAARVADALFAQYLYRPHLERMTETRRSEFGTVYMRSGLSALAAVLPSVALMAYWHFSPEVSLLETGIAVALGLVLWLFVLRTTDHLLYREIQRALRQVRAFKARPRPFPMQ